MSAQNNNNNNNNINSPADRILPTSNHQGILFPIPSTADELGSGLVIEPMATTVETTPVVTREVEIVPQLAGSFYSQEEVTESKSNPSDEDSEESQRLEDCNGGLTSRGVEAQFFDGVLGTGTRRTGTTSPVVLRLSNSSSEMRSTRRYHTTRGTRVTGITEAWRILGLSGPAGESALAARNNMLRYMYPYLKVTDAVALADRIEMNKVAHNHCWELGLSLTGNNRKRDTDRLWKWSEATQGATPFDRSVVCPADDRQHRLDQFHDPMREGIIWDLLDTVVSEPWPLMSHVDFANLVSGMAPHDIVYTTHIITAMLSKARACYQSRQHFYEGFKYYVENSEECEKELHRLEDAAQLEKNRHQQEKLELENTVQQLQADLFHAEEDAQVNAYELEKAEAAREQYKQDILRIQRLRTSADMVTANQASLANRYGERLAEVNVELANKTAELNEISEQLISSRGEVSELLLAIGEQEDERKQVRAQCTALEEELKAANQRVRDLEENHQQDMAVRNERIQDIERLEDEARELRSREQTETRRRVNAVPAAAATSGTARQEERPRHLETPFLPTRQGT
jgi:hypothetical protein